MVDTTTYCNARCPQCDRNNNKDLKQVDWLPSLHWSLDQFKYVFSKDVLAKTVYVDLVPTWGDAGMNPHTYDMIKYLVDAAPHVEINFDTNGSMRNEDYWFKLAGLTDRLNIIFDVDGINQEMHSVYRNNTKLDKVLANMQAAADAGIARIKSQTILFKHNQDYMDDIKQLAFDNGSTSHTTIISDRGVGPVNSYYDSYTDQSITLEKADLEKTKGGRVAKVNSALSNKLQTDESITCTWTANNNFVIGFDGQVYPCCYIYNSATSNRMRGNKPKDHMYMWYEENKDEYNVFNHSIIDIIKRPYFQQYLPQSWESDTPLKICTQHCSKKGINTQIPRLIAKG